MTELKGTGIIDAQVHLNHYLPNWKDQPFEKTLDAAISKMNELGIDKVVIGEVYGLDSKFRQIGEVQENDARRVSTKFSRYAVNKFPSRFLYYALLDPMDLDLENYLAELSLDSNFLGIRAIPLIENGDVSRLKSGEFDRLFSVAENLNLPVFIWVPSRAQDLLPYLNRFPSLRFVIDHIGVGAAPLRSGEPLPITTASSLTEILHDRLKEFESICEMSRFPNLYIKWSHAPMLLTESDYPYFDLIPLLQRAVDAFGADRIIWASDITVARLENGNSWEECIHYLSDNPELDINVKEWIFRESLLKLHNARFSESWM